MCLVRSIIRLSSFFKGAMVTKHQWQIHFNGTFKNSHTPYINQTCRWILDHDHAFTPHSYLRHSYTHTHS